MVILRVKLECLYILEKITDMTRSLPLNFCRLIIRKVGVTVSVKYSSLILINRIFTKYFNKLMPRTQRDETETETETETEKKRKTK